MTYYIETKNTCLILGVLKNGLLSCLHYGARIKPRKDDACLYEKFDVCYGSMVAYSRDDSQFGLDDVCLACSSVGRGDFREPALDMVFADGSSTLDLKFVSCEILEEKPDIPGLPSSYGDAQTHVFTLEDECVGVRVKLMYSAFYDCDVITESMEVQNLSHSAITLKRAMSCQLDLIESDFELMTFTGAWALERQRQVKPLSPGIYVNSSSVGVSSARANPFIMLKRSDAAEHTGDVYAFNLVYSGNHAETVECTHTGKTRVLCGINPASFSWELLPESSFFTPEAVMSFSSRGLNGASQNMHEFVKEHIVRGVWKKRARPVLVNNWEGTWFDFDERKLLDIAGIASKLGVELFVLDDGWFGDRNDDTRALGDWFVNKKKLPHGLDGLQKRIRELKMDFGLWVEPEMISENSELYRAHPDWAIKLPNRTPALGRNQLILDLTNKEVRDYITETMSTVFSLADISYIKWDMNRNFSDAYTSSLPASRQGEFFHRYTMGLYEVLAALTEKFPDILFESCASGGNRFDLGMLCYMPQVWTSDNTDPISRLSIQGGTSYGYPQSVMGAHVSASPHQSTLRTTQVETRFNVSAFGLLGYEMDLTELTPFDKNCIKAQIAYYKAHRELFQFGTFTRMISPFDSDRPVFAVVSGDKSESLVCAYQKNAVATHTHDLLKVYGLDPEREYSVSGREQFISVKAFGGLVKHVMPVKIKGDGVPMTLIAQRYMFKNAVEEYTAGGDMLAHAGLRLLQQFGGTGYNESIRVLGDFGSRMYYIRAID